MSGQLGLLFAPLPPSVGGMNLAKALASYSADVIALAGKVRKPVSCGGDLWVSIGGGGTAAHRVTKMYRLVPVDEFEGEVTTYHEKTSLWLEGDKYPGDYARNDPNGFYHGMKVSNGGNAYALCGPEQTIDVTNVVELIESDNEDEPAYDDDDEDMEWNEDDEDEDEASNAA